MNRRYRELILCVLLLSFLDSLPQRAFALDPQKSINQYGRNTWTRQNGLPTNTVNSILQSRDGYIWIGTSAGLFRFDGVTYTLIGTDPDDSKNL
jgi:ligand-binding sensor domain-containing protein